MSRPLREPSSRNRRFALLFGVAAVVFAPSVEASEDQGTISKGSVPSSSDEPAPTVTPRVELRYDPIVDGVVTAGLATGLVVWPLFKDDVAPTKCHVCDGSPGQVNAIDDFFRTALRRPSSDPAKLASDITAYGVAPLAVVGLGAAIASADKRGNETLANLLLMAEATFTAVALTEPLELILARERPYVHALSGDAKQEAIADGNALASLPSGHTTAVFAAFTSMGTIATMRGYRLAPLLFVSGAFLGVAEAYFRIAADQHYFTDTLAGATIGIGTGALVPWIFHRPVGPETGAARWLGRTTVASTAVPGGRVVSVGWAF